MRTAGSQRCILAGIEEIRESRGKGGERAPGADAGGQTDRAGIAAVGARRAQPSDEWKQPDLELVGNAGVGFRFDGLRQQRVDTVADGIGLQLDAGCSAGVWAA